ncbi:ribonuclease R [Thermodesulfovibrionales bacterium]|nr:ribonuclease R [Thermodesulfovibrionales bacterium]
MAEFTRPRRQRTETKQMLTKDSLTSFFREKTTSPISLRDITSRLNLASSEKHELKRLLKEMINDGVVVRTRNRLYGPAEEMSLATGHFEAHRDGYGFVILERPGERDIFVPARATFGAMNNDRVIVRIENFHRREGRIIRILERVQTRLVGVLDGSRTGFYVRPKNRSMPFDLHIAPQDKGRAEDRDIVIAEIVSYPTDKRPPTGRIVKILSKPETPKDEVERVIDELNLPRKFPSSVLEEAKRLYAEEVKDKGQKRKDLRGLPTVTIDGEAARDFEDAVSIQATEEGYKLYVHIADVGFYIKWGSLLDAEAKKRGTSIYFPDRVIPMLPKGLSEDLCSLKPKADRLAFTIEMDFDRHGEGIDRRFYPSLIMSDERMTYTAVKEILIDKAVKTREKYSYLLPEFELMAGLCNILKDRRLKRGSLDFDLSEPDVLLDTKGSPENIIRAERNFAQMMIEEFMIAANEAVAEHLEDIGLPCLYRVHEKPDPRKLEEMMKIIKVTPTLKGVKGRRVIKPEDFHLLLRQVRGSLGEEIMNHMILRSLKRARYSHLNVGHFGLASESYTHFTSPIRRYPDLVVHRILREVIAKKTLSAKRITELESVLPGIAFHSSAMERRECEAEGVVLSAMMAWFMKDKVGEEFAGRVVSVTPYGLKVRLSDYYVDGFLHVSFMSDDFYRYNEETMSLYGTHKKKRFTIGNEVRVRLDKVDMENKEIIFGI